MYRTTTRALRVGIIALAAVAFTVAFTWGEQQIAEAACSKTRTVDIGNGKTKKVPRVGKPERRFGGKVLTSGKRFSTWARSVNSYMAKVKKNTKKKFWENKEKKEWKIYFIAFFKRPHDDPEVTIKIWDLSKGNKHMVSSFEQFLDRCATSYASNVVLKRERFGVNKELMITVEGRSRTLAAGKFKILGEAEKFTGKADFSDEIAKPEDEPDEDAIAAAKRANDERAADEPDEVAEKTEDPIDYENSDLDDTPDLKHEDGMEGGGASGEVKSKRGCGCHHGGPEDMAAGGLVLIGAFFLLRRRRKPGSDR